MRTIQRNIVSALIFSKDGKLFQGKKDPKSGGVYIDCWHIPGGGIEEGEDKVQALIREVTEETGIDLSSYQIELTDDIGRGESIKKLKDPDEEVLCQMTFNVYKIVINDKNANEITISLNDDLAEYRWTVLNELSSLRLTPPSVSLFQRLGYLPKVDQA